MEDTNALKRKDPWFTVCLSSLMPGIGQIYAKRKNIGIIILLVNFALITTFIYLAIAPTITILWGLIAIVIIILFQIWNLFDAHKSARIFNTTIPDGDTKAGTSKNPWLAVFLSRFLPGLGQLYCRKRVKGVLFIIGAVVFGYLKDQYYWAGFAEKVYDGLVMYDAWNSAQGQPKQPKKTIIVFAAVAVLLPFFAYGIAFSALDGYSNPSSAMAPAIMKRDRFLTEKVTYKFSEPQPGDIIVFKSPEAPKTIFVKRLVAKGGDIVEVKQNKVYVNGKLFKAYTTVIGDKYAVFHFRDSGPYEVPSNCYFVIGDNLNNSRDSRDFGPVPKENIIGKFLKIYWPPAHFKNNTNFTKQQLEKLRDFVSDNSLLPENEKEFTRRIDYSLERETEGIGVFDAWGNPYRYVREEGENHKQSYLIYSYGENGTDEKGKGDDISITGSVR